MFVREKTRIAPSVPTMATEATAVTMGHLRAGFLSRSGVTSLTMGDIVSSQKTGRQKRDFYTYSYEQIVKNVFATPMTRKKSPNLPEICGVTKISFGKADARTELDFDFPVKLEIEIAKSDARTQFFGSTRKIKPSYELEAGFPARFPVKIELLETGELSSRFPNSIS